MGASLCVHESGAGSHGVVRESPASEYRYAYANRTSGAPIPSGAEAMQLRNLGKFSLLENSIRGVSAIETGWNDDYFPAARMLPHLMTRGAVSDLDPARFSEFLRNVSVIRRSHFAGLCLERCALAFHQNSRCWTMVLLLTIGFSYLFGGQDRLRPQHRLTLLQLEADGFCVSEAARIR